jgi:hypothetical protein
MYIHPGSLEFPGGQKTSTNWREGHERSILWQNIKTGLLTTGGVQQC